MNRERSYETRLKYAEDKVKRLEDLAAYLAWYFCADCSENSGGKRPCEGVTDCDLRPKLQVELGLFPLNEHCLTLYKKVFGKELNGR